MKLSQGDNHLISTRDGVAICQVWSRPDLSPEDGARNAQQMSEFLRTEVLQPGAPYRGLVFDVRRGPTVFGPRTREALAALFSAAATNDLAIAVLVGESPIQLLQFRNLCRDAGQRADVFNEEGDAIGWLTASSPS
jgi:hypothetical protein